MLDLFGAEMPLAFRFPQICDGEAPPIWFHTTEAAEGCWKVVVSPALILKDCQLRKAFCEAVTFNCEPLVTAVALPLVTVMPCGLANAVRVNPAANKLRAQRQGSACRETRELSLALAPTLDCLKVMRR